MHKFRSELSTPLRETHSVVAVFVKAVHEARQFSLCCVESVVGEHISKLVATNESIAVAVHTLEGRPDLEVGALGQHRAQLFHRALCLEHDPPQAVELHARVRVEEALKARASSAEVLGPVGDQRGVLLTERQNRCAKFVKRHRALTCLVHSLEEHVDIVAAELAVLQRVSQTFLEIVRAHRTGSVHVKHTVGIEKVEIGFQGQIDFLTFNFPF